METPSSTRRVTRSQALTSLNSNNNNIPTSRKIEDSEKCLSMSRQRNMKQQQDRSVLVDITNDSPIVGLAMGSLETPSSAMAKQRSIRAKNKTPGSGEALLRGQVKTLLQKVEGEAEVSKLSLESRTFLQLKGLVKSPMGLLAPTPANTPQLSNLSQDGCLIINGGLPSAVPSPVVEERLIPQVISNIFDGKEEVSLESDKTVTRSLLLDFSEKFDSSDSSECSSELTFQGENGIDCKEKSSTEEDDASVWSIQVNASTHDEDEEEVIEEEEEEEEEEYYDEEFDEEEDDGGLVDELCEGISNISVNAPPKFEGKHTRFVYDSDDELVGVEDSAGVSPSVLRLKGLPTPKGKHLRFPLEE